MDFLRRTSLPSLALLKNAKGFPIKISPKTKLRVYSKAVEVQLLKEKFLKFFVFI